MADRKKKMDGHCSTGQSPQRAVVPMEEEEDVKMKNGRFCLCLRRKIVAKRQAIGVPGKKNTG